MHRLAVEAVYTFRTQGGEWFDGRVGTGHWAAHWHHHPGCWFVCASAQLSGSLLEAFTSDTYLAPPPRLDALLL
jgi:hypothetical protein